MRLWGVNSFEVPTAKHGRSLRLLTSPRTIAKKKICQRGGEAGHAHSCSRVNSRSKLRLIILKNYCHQIILTVVVDRERSFASVVNRVTDCYKVAFQSINPLNRINRYP